MIPLRRRMRGFQRCHRVVRNLCHIDAAAAHLLQRGADRSVALNHLAAGARGHVDVAAWAPAAHRLQPRHLQHLQRLHQAVDVDIGLRVQLAHGALRQRVEPLGEFAQLEFLRGAGGRHRVGGAGREERALPAAVARPAADRGAADASLLRDLAIGQHRRLDQAAHLRAFSIPMRSPGAAHAWAAHKGIRRLGFIGRDAQAKDGAEEGMGHT